MRGTLLSSLLDTFWGTVSAFAFLALVMGGLVNGSSAARGQDDPEEDGVMVKVRGEWQKATLPLAELDEGKPVEVKVIGKLSDGVFAIGGETTGTVITFGKTTWELDLRDNEKLRAAAEKLDGKKVVVTGKVRTKRGVEIPLRTIVSVATLEAK